MAELLAPVTVYGRMAAARLRSDWQYRTSFVALMISQSLVTALEFAALIMIVDLVPSLGQWTRAEVAFLYALAAVPFALSDLLISPVETTSRHVQEGTFDRLLLRPVSPLVQLWALEFELRRGGKMAAPLGVLVWSIGAVEIEWTAAAIVLLVMALVCGTLIYGALWILTAAVAFWAVASKEATNAFTYGGQFANEYPLHLYRGWLRFVLGWAVPLAYVAYVPSQHILGAANPLGLPPWLIYTTPAVTLAIGVVAIAVYRLGIRHYQSTGS